MNIAIILASGMGARMKSSIPKQFLELNGRPIILRTLDIFVKHNEVDKIILVISRDMEEYYNENIKSKLETTKQISIVYGGEERYESVYNALLAVSKDANLVLIHDGVRPFVKHKEISQVMEMAEKKGAAILVKRIIDTVKLVEDGIVTDTLDRNLLYGAVTPQVFKYNVIMEAYNKMKTDNKIFIATDDSMVVERFVQEVYIVEGGNENIKITNPVDIFIGNEILDMWNRDKKINII
ncbi:MAG: 2-C-methyl-D-erythritol 4-phosphate cytidylyltransferase [Filifactoraceae bacterium]